MSFIASKYSDCSRLTHNEQSLTNKIALYNKNDKSATPYANRRYNQSFDSSTDAYI